jgi:hypothetical protein
MWMLSQIQGTIERRLLVNFVADPEIVKKILPDPFRPKIYSGHAVIGICLISFAHLRARGLPKFLGMASENAAHRFAVEWDTPQGVKSGVYIARRDSNSYLTTTLGGLVFSGIYHHAYFTTLNQDPKYKVQFKSSDSSTFVVVDGEVNSEWPKESIFKNQETSSEFFESGSIGYSPSRSHRSSGMQLFVDKWSVDHFKITTVESSFFDNQNIFPKDSVRFDHALIMRSIEHYWKTVPEL